ncbi:FMN-binding glutamate synthase family protein [Paenibacillus sp. HB172176]|uniref:FMN-binding glutamate synthase family protein n=1 Tax=Paenibacillus sp. HB172176 TaxID=2493690 RepID=UPI001439C0DB|nr:FMN-binding glutamate synthase family protein [Paenibacillus sp. HB172176]
MYLALFIILIALLVLPPLILLGYMYIVSKKPQHSIIRAHPYLGWLRYLLEKLGPEFRQYWFDNDTEGKPFSRAEYEGLVFAAKYRTDLISFGSRRDYEKAGFYIGNSMYPKLVEDLRVANREELDGKKYHIIEEGMFTRKENLRMGKVKPWLLEESDAIVFGELRRHPWRVRGMFGASATSYGSVGEHYILSTGSGARMAGGSWINTGEGGVAPEHLATGADVISQIGPGLFGYRDDHGQFSFDEFRAKAAEPNIKAFELKFAQGAKIRGGHLEGVKVNEKIAQIRKVPVGQTVNSPNRFPFLNNSRETMQFIGRLQEEGGKPVGIKIVVGYAEGLNEFFQAMIDLDIYPDFITVDGSEGGSGATFKSMADSMGLPLYSALIAVDDAARSFGIRDKFRIIASGKLISSDKVAVALGLGADAVNSARGFMMANGCIMALQCETGRCPSGVATADPRYMDALVPEEKQWRVMNYVIQLRESLFALAAACGLDSPRQLTRDHIVFRDVNGKTKRISELYPYPDQLEEAEHESDRSYGEVSGG